MNYPTFPLIECSAHVFKILALLTVQLASHSIFRLGSIYKLQLLTLHDRIVYHATALLFLAHFA